jgi:hypothetical protein
MLVGGFVVWITRILGTLAFGREAMGLGDVHLMGAVGAVLGAGAAVVAFFLAPFFGIVLAIYLLATGTKKELPYGPYLRLGTAFVMLFYCPIAAWLAPGLEGLRYFVGKLFGMGGGMPEMTPEKIREFEKTHGRGSAWGEEENRAVVRVFDPEGKVIRNYATGLRNCSGLAMQPGTDNVWCVVNERDHVGPDAVPDFMALVQDGAFYGWPWYAIGDREDPALQGKRPDLRDGVRVPEVLLQAHSSALSLAFYDHDAFPAEYRGDAFVALHGSHSRPQMTGYKVVRVRMKDGSPTGEYEDFLTGFVLDSTRVWGRPASVAVTSDGALLVSDDANGTIFRVARK